MNMVRVHAHISELAVKWLDSKAKAERKVTGASISRADLIRRAVGEMRAREMAVKERSGDASG